MADYTFRNGKRLRTGFTTGLCAAAAAKAAVMMLLTGNILQEVEIAWQPGGRAERESAGRECAGSEETVGIAGSGQASEGRMRHHVFQLEQVELTQSQARCGVRKDAGDDADVTDGLLILAEARLAGSAEESFRSEGHTGQEDRRTVEEKDVDRSGGRYESSDRRDWNPPAIRILGGEGVGRVTLPGLDQPVGEAAINSGPRRMIREAVRSAWNECCKKAAEKGNGSEGFCSGDTDCLNDSVRTNGSLIITISVPGGTEIAEKTFNPILGIEGGISILGTTGIVDPMSGAAAEESVRTEIRVKCARRLSETGSAENDSKRNGQKAGTAYTVSGSGDPAGIVLTPGNTGAAFAEQKLGIVRDHIILCSNYFGAAIDEACLQGIGKILFIGALGKMIKLAGGIFNTHSYESDARLDILMRCALQAGADQEVLREIDGCVTTESALEVLKNAGLAERTADLVSSRALMYIRRRCGRREEAPDCEIILLSSRGELLAASVEALTMAAYIAVRPKTE